MRRRILVVASVAAALALVPGAALAVTANTMRVSISSGGAQANDYSDSPSISADGYLVVFSSRATNLVGGDTNGVADIFVHNRKTGTTRRVSFSSSRAQANGPSYAPAISGNGRYVVFVSDASNLVARDTNGVGDIFVRDRWLGKTRRVSISSAGAQANDYSNGYGDSPSISADGRLVVFSSRATNLVRRDTNGVADIFVHNRETGKTGRVSVSSSGAQANKPSSTPAISSNRRYVVFVSDASNLVARDTNGLASDIFVRDRWLGKTRRVNISSAGVQANDYSFSPSISADGDHVAFASYAWNLVGGEIEPDQSDIYVRDVSAGKTRRVSISSAGTEAKGGGSYAPSISGDGNVIAFSSEATNLVGGDTNWVSDIFVHNRTTGTTGRVSISSSGAQANGWSWAPAISGNRRYVVFVSEASNLVAGDSNNMRDVFVRDRWLG